MSDRAAELHAALLAAETPAAIIEAVARAVWFNERAGAECPAHSIPTVDELCNWLPKFLHHSPNHALNLVVTLAFHHTVESTPPAEDDTVKDAFMAAGISLDHPALPQAQKWFTADSIEWLHRLWLDHDHPQRHPLAPLVAAWQERPPEKPHETRADRRIMPALRVVGPALERERGRRLFGGLLDGRPREADLLLFPEREPQRHHVPLLDIAERTGLPFRSRGKGASVESRLVVRGGLLNLRPEDRKLPVVRIAVTVGELLDALWPPSAKRGRPRDADNWPKLLDALYRARDFHVPDAKGGRWFPLALRRLPPETGTRPARDALIVLDLAPVPGSETGSSVDLPWLDRMGVTNGPRWFAYLAGRSAGMAPWRDTTPGARHEGQAARVEPQPC